MYSHTLPFFLVELDLFNGDPFLRLGETCGDCSEWELSQKYFSPALIAKKTHFHAEFNCFALLFPLNHLL